ncbi:MAG TPA: hypothetical protein VKK79_20020 [Candidatus Lokiarchaeia archaeon]|nr:hypothetical protein [Candidatus Lokiarchaeia archaeon]
MEKKPALTRYCNIDLNEADLDPKDLASDLVDDVIGGKMKVFDVRRTIISIRHPGIRLKVDYEFRRLLRERMNVRGIDNWESYTRSLRSLKSRFNPE